MAFKNIIIFKNASQRYRIYSIPFLLHFFVITMFDILLDSIFNFFYIKIVLNNILPLILKHKLFINSFLRIA